MKARYLIVVTVNGYSTTADTLLTGKPILSYPEAEAEARRTTLNDCSHLSSYRVEVVENYGDRSRYAIFDKSWN